MEGLIREGSLGEILFRSQIIDEADIRNALAEQGRLGCRFGEALVHLGIVTQEDIDWALSNQLNIPFVRLRKDLVDPAAVRLVPAALARRFGLLPLLIIGDELSIAMIDPLNAEAVAAVEEATGCRVTTVSIALIREMHAMHDAFYGPGEGEETLGLSSEALPAALLAKMNADMTGTTAVDGLLQHLLRNRLDALAARPLRDDVVLFAREDGGVAEIGRIPAEGYRILLDRMKRLCRLQDGGGEARRGVIAFRHEGREVPLQALFLPARGGECLTVRRRVFAPFPTAVGQFREARRDAGGYPALAGADRGLILVQGSDGEERNRLIDLYLDERSTRGKGVLLLGESLGRGREDFARVSPDGRTPSEAAALLAEATDQDVDILAVEDASDARLLAAAGVAAARGKLVLAGIVGGGRGALCARLDALRRRQPFLLAHLRGILACRGVPTLCPACREEHAPAAAELAALGAPSPAVRFFRAGGCAECGHTGHGGRVYLLDAVAFPPGEGPPEGFPAGAGLEEEGRKLLEAGEVSLAEYLASFAPGSSADTAQEKE